MLEEVIGGNTVESWGISALILLGTFVVIKLVSFINRRLIKSLTRKTKTQLDDIVYNSLEAPLLFGIALVGFWLALSHLAFPEKVIVNIGKAYRILIVLNITWFFARLVDNFLNDYLFGVSGGTNKSGKAWKNLNKMSPIVRRTLLVLVWVIGIVMALSNIGIEISALLGTLGIGGIAFALAAQDTIKNIFSAFTILTDRPFAIGDVVRIDSYEGTIIDIGVRSTKMRNYDKRVITFPNYKISDASVINISSEPMRRVVANLGLTYDTSADKMREAIAILTSMPTRVEYVSSKDIVANFSEFADSAMVISFVYFIEKKGNIRQTISNVNLEILTAFNAAGLNFAFPTQTLYVEKGELV